MTTTMTIKLFSDSNTLRVEYSGNCTVKDIANDNGYLNRVRLIAHIGYVKTYREDKTGKCFDITCTRY